LQLSRDTNSQADITSFTFTIFVYCKE